MKIYLGSPLTADGNLILKKGVQDNWCLSFYHYAKSPWPGTKVLHKYSIKWFIDSGAFSICNFFRTDMRDTTYMDSPEFRKFMELYIEFLHRYKDRFDCYVNMDIIHDPVRTWENQLYLEANGLQPLPVYHHKEDIKWLKRYIDNYPYICLSNGMGKNLTNDFLEALDRKYAPLLFRDGSIKVHALGITKPPLLAKYRWHSSDSVSWGMIGNKGRGVMIPEYTGGGFNFLHYRERKVKDIRKNKMSLSEIEGLKKWLIECGIGSDENKFTSCCNAEDIFTIYSPLELYQLRCRINCYYYRGLEKQLTEMEGGEVVR